MSARRLMRSAALFSLFFGLLLAAPWAAAIDFPKSELTIETATGGRHPFRVEIAVTPAQRAQGLMHRPSLEPDAGMLFLYEREGEIAMWMKNTLVSLDMLFFSRGGEILRIAERTVPHSTDVIASGQPVKGVLEVPAGTADRLGIKPGDRILHPSLKN